MGKEQKLKKLRKIERMQEEVHHSRKALTWGLIVLGVVLLAAGGVWSFIIIKQKASEPMKNPVAVIETAKGTIKFEMFPEAAPKTVENFVTLAKKNYYNGTTFHRVLANFVIQGGDPLSKDKDSASTVGTGGPGYTFEDEINAKSLGLADAVIKQNEAAGYKYRTDLTSMKMLPGVIAMANSGPGTNGSQFFIVINTAQPHLDGKHTVFGKVTEGMDVVAKIAQGDVMTKVSIEE